MSSYVNLNIRSFICYLSLYLSCWPFQLSVKKKKKLFTSNFTYFLGCGLSFFRVVYLCRDLIALFSYFNSVCLLKLGLSCSLRYRWRLVSDYIFLQCHGLQLWLLRNISTHPFLDTPNTNEQNLNIFWIAKIWDGDSLLNSLLQWCTVFLSVYWDTDCSVLIAPVCGCCCHRQNCLMSLI